MTTIPHPDDTKLSFPSFEVMHNWHEIFSKAVKAANDKDVELPQELCLFRLEYLPEPVMGFVCQDATTHEIGVLFPTLQEERKMRAIYLGCNLGVAPTCNVGADIKHATEELFKQHVLCACISMEVKTAGSFSYDSLGLSPKDNSDVSNYFKILPLRSRNKAADLSNVSKKSGRRLRWHIRRGYWRMNSKGELVRVKWYVSGNIDLGVIVRENDPVY